MKVPEANRGVRAGAAGVSRFVYGFLEDPGIDDVRSLLGARAVIDPQRVPGRWPAVMSCVTPGTFSSAAKLSPAFLVSWRAASRGASIASLVGIANFLELATTSTHLVPTLTLVAVQ